jgi:hypothetical protein
MKPGVGKPPNPVFPGGFTGDKTFSTPEEKGRSMKRMLWGATFLISALLLITGCDTALTVGSKTIGIRSREFIFTDGYLRATYLFPFDKTWTACDKTLTAMKATDVERIRKIAQGNFTAMIQDEKVRISVDYVEKEITAVAVRVGSSGNNLASQLIHDRIANTMKTP